MTKDERERRKIHYDALKAILEEEGIEGSVWDALRRNVIPEPHASGLRKAVAQARDSDLSRQTMVRLNREPPKWPDWMKVGIHVKGVARWRKGMRGVVEEIRPDGLAIVDFGGDKFAFDPGEVELDEKGG